MKKLICIYLFTFFCFGLKAQDNISQLSKQISRQINTAPGSKLQQEGNSFLQDLEEGRFTQKEEKNILRLFKLIRQKKFNTKTVYLNLFRILNAYQDERLNENDFNLVLDYFGINIHDNLLDQSLITLSNLGEFISEEQLFSSPEFSWQCNNSNWYIEDEVYLSVRFEQVDITLITGAKNLQIKNTSGDYRLDNGTFYGNNGTIDWESYGISSNRRDCELDRYEFNSHSPYFRAENVRLNDSQFSQNEIMGILRFQKDKNSLPESPSYTMRFESYEIFPVANFHPNIEAKAGIRLINEKSEIYPPMFHKMEFDFYLEGKKFLKIETTKYRLTDNQFTAKDARFYFDIKGDSITHPMVNFEYFMDQDLFHASVSENPIGVRTPFENNYHELQILADHCYWDLAVNQLIFENKSMSSLDPVKYQSLRYFHPNWFINMFGMEAKHPTSPLRRLSKENKWQRKFHIQEVLDIYDTDEETLHLLMTEFTNHGFIEYDPIQQFIVIKDRFFRFYDGLKKKKDYDQLRIVSNINNRPSGIIDLETGVLDIHKVHEVNVNAKQITSFYPEDEIVHVYPDLDMSFDGTTICSKFAFFGENQQFNYKDYTFRFDRIDSLRYLLEVPIKDSIFIQPCRTVLQEISGVLEIDKPNNKSSKKKYSQYPKLTVDESSYVYYNEIKDGIYPKSDFYFEAEKFELTSLKKIKTDKLVFPGKLISGGIFPDIEETLVLNKQKELGFQHKTKGSYTLFDRGSFKDNLILDNDGLHGTGMLNYNGLTMSCDSTDFYPIYLFAHAEQLESYPFKAPYSIPKIQGADMRLDWFIQDGILEIKNLENPFDLYANHSLNGGLEATDTALLAYGTLITENIVCHSGDIHLKNKAWKAIKSKLRLYQSPQYPDFYTDEEIIRQEEANLVYLTEERKLISGEKGKSKSFELPHNHYRLNMERMEYALNNDQILFETRDSLLIGSFISTHPFQDSLEIWGNKASLDLLDLSLEFEDIKGVKVADALIKPKNDFLKLDEIAFLDTLQEANLQLIDEENRVKYQFQNAEVSIKSKSNYQASADFVYTNRIGEQQAVRFEDIHVTEKGKSYGEAEINEEDNFYLDPQISFLGSLVINDEKGAIMAEGSTRFHDPCAYLDGPNFHYSDSLDKFNVYLDKVSKKEASPFASLMFNPETYEVYPAFCIDPKGASDISLMKVEGRLKYNLEENQYEVRTKNTEEHASLNMECAYWMEGFFQLSHSPFIQDLAYGTVQWIENQPENTEIELHFGLDLPLPEKAMKWMRKDVIRKLKQEERSDEDQSSFNNFLQNVIGAEQTSRYFKAKRKGRYFVHPSMRKSIFFTGLQMLWNPDEEQFESTNEYISLNHIEGNKVDRLVKGKVHYRPSNEGDYWYILLEFEEEGYYSIEIDGDILYTASSEQKYNRLIQKKAKDKKKKGTLFQVSLSPDLKRLSN